MSDSYPRDKKLVVLYNPCERREARIPALPLSLISIGTVLEGEGYEVRVIDGRVEKNAHEKVFALADRALFFGTTSVTGSALFDALKVSREMKKRGVPVVWGGFHSSLYPEQTLNEQGIDFVVVGQAESTIRELASELQKPNPDFGGVAGLWYRREGRAVATAPRKFEDINQFPPFNYDLVNAETYIRPDVAPRTLDYLSSRGCPHPCTFCSIQTVYGLKWLSYKPERVVDELEQFSKRYGLDGFHILDDNFNVDRRRVAEICDLIVARKLRLKLWVATRIDYFVTFSDELMAKMKAAGIDTINFGAESGSNRMLALIKKEMTRDKIVEAAKRAREWGFNCQFSFIMGYPQERPEDFEQTLDIMDQVHAANPHAEMMMYTYTPFPGTPLFEESMKYGLEVPDSLEGWGNYKYEHASAPWLSPEQKKLFDTLSYLSWFAFAPGIEVKLRKPHLKLAYKVLRRFARFRWHHRFFAFPVEWRLVDRVIAGGP